MRRRDAGGDAGTVVHGQAHIIAALVALHRRALRPFRARPAGGRRAAAACRAATSAMSATTAEAVASPPAPGPIRVSSRTASASMVTALVTPITCAMDEVCGTMVGWTRCSMPVSVRSRDAEQLDAEAELVRHREVGGGDRGDALHIDRLGVDLGAEGEARQDRELVGGVEALRRRRSGRPPHSRAAARPPGTRRRSGPPPPCGRGYSCRCR